MSNSEWYACVVACASGGGICGPICSTNTGSDGASSWWMCASPTLFAEATEESDACPTISELDDVLVAPSRTPLGSGARGAASEDSSDDGYVGAAPACNGMAENAMPCVSDPVESSSSEEKVRVLKVCVDDRRPRRRGMCWCGGARPLIRAHSVYGIPTISFMSCSVTTQIAW